jgi:hypothetical protein
MFLKKLLIVLVIFSSIFTYAQDMQEGFTYLETGKYNKAEIFFDSILKEHPTNKTAR